MPPTQMISWVKPASFGEVGRMGTRGSWALPLTSGDDCSSVLPLAWFRRSRFADCGGPALKSEGSLWRGATCFWRAIAGSFREYRDTIEVLWVAEARLVIMAVATSLGQAGRYMRSRRRDWLVSSKIWRNCNLSQTEPCAWQGSRERVR